MRDEEKPLVEVLHFSVRTIYPELRRDRRLQRSGVEDLELPEAVQHEYLVSDVQVVLRLEVDLFILQFLESEVIAGLLRYFEQEELSREGHRYAVGLRTDEVHGRKRQRERRQLLSRFLIEDGQLAHVRRQNEVLVKRRLHVC